jgi:hypothetical protein
MTLMQPGFPVVTNRVRAAAVLALAAGLAAGPVGAQEPTARPSQSITGQGALDQRGLADLLRQRIQQSGLSADHIRARLRSAGYAETAIDSYLSPTMAGQAAPAPSLEVLRAATAAGLGDFGVSTDSLNAFRRQVALSVGDSILLDSLGIVLAVAFCRSKGPMECSAGRDRSILYPAQ